MYINVSNIYESFDRILMNPPDVYFDGMTWDFKAPTYQNVETDPDLIKAYRFITIISCV